MATITSIKNGNWSDTSTWDSGTIPTASDNVVISHSVKITQNATASTILVDASGTLNTSSLASGSTLTVDHITLYSTLVEDRTLRLDGLNLNIGHPSISGGNPSIYMAPAKQIMSSENEVIIDDPGLYGFSAQMQDIKPEGMVRAHARKVSNGVRYLNVVVHIRKDKSNVIGDLYTLAEYATQVLAVTNSAVIKGFIEAITPVDNVGKEYRAFRVSIAEGP